MLISPKYILKQLLVIESDLRVVGIIESKGKG
jgi:hypothetical protein